MKYLLCLALALVASAATAQSLALTNHIPKCRIAPARQLPSTYERLAKNDKAFSWLKSASSGEDVMSGKGENEWMVQACLTGSTSIELI
jgi:hypothetical protein